MENLKEKAHEYLTNRGCLKMGQQYPAFVVENMLVEFAEQQLKNCNLQNVSNNEVAFANEIEKRWNEYRINTNNEDAWCFKQWLVGK